jgi:hypothetical protein
LFALINLDVSCGGSLVNYFLFLHYAAFGDDYRVNRDCALGRNRTSAGEAVSAMISKSAATQFLVTITESTGLVRTDKSRHQLGRSSGDDFLVGRDSLSVMIFESTGTVCAD